MEYKTLFLSFTAASLIIPLIFIITILIYRGFFCEGRKTTNARSEKFIPMLDMDLKTYVAIYAFVAFSYQLTSVLLFTLVEIDSRPYYNVPKGVMFTVFAVWVASGVVELVLMSIAVLVFLFNTPNRLKRTPPPPYNEITTTQPQSQGFASVHLTRFESPEKIVFFANCRSDCSVTVFKLAFVQAKEEGAKTNCYLLDDEFQSAEKITPTLVTVDELEKVFRAEQE